MHSKTPPECSIPLARRTSADQVRFARGELTEIEYLERHVELAMAHVKGRISDEHFDMIREMLMELLDSDPVLVAMKERLLWKNPGSEQ